MKNQLFTLAAVLTASAALTGCSSEQLVENQKVETAVQTYQLQIGARKSSNDFTRALDDNGTKLIAKWATGDKVYAYINDAAADGDAIELTPSTFGTNNTVLTGSLTKSGGFTTSDVIHLYYLKKKSAYDSRTYTGQDGDLDKIASNYDYATADVNILAVAPTGNDNILRTSDATFTHLQAITKFTVEKKNNVAMGEDKVTALNITASEGLSGGLDITPTGSGLTTIYVAMSNPTSGDATYNFDATLGGKKYAATKAVTLANDKYYTATLTMGKSSGAFDLQLPTSPTFTGSEIVINPQDEDGEDLTEGTDYSVTYYKKNPSTDEYEVVNSSPYIKGAGDYKVVVEGMGNYEGTTPTEFTVEKGTPEITIPAEKNNQILNPAGTLDLGITVTTGLTASDLTYAISSTPATGVVNVTNGVVTAVGGGKATITVKYPATGDADRNAATEQTITVYVKQSGIGGNLGDPSTGTSW